MNTTKHLLVLATLLLAALTVHAALTVTTTAPISFGRFVAGAGGSIRMDANGTRSSSGGVILLASSYGPASYIAQDVANTNPDDILILTLPTDGEAVLQSGPDSMALTGFASTLPVGGYLGLSSQTFMVGATLQVGPNQPAGNYSGSFNITLNYQ